MAFFKIGLLNVLPEENLKVPFIISDELFNNPNDYEISTTYIRDIPTIDDAVEYIRNLDSIKDYLEIPFLVNNSMFPETFDFISKYVSCFPNLVYTNYSSDNQITIGSYNYGRIKYHELDVTSGYSGYYDNIDSTYQHIFPQLENNTYGLRQQGYRPQQVIIDFRCSIIPSSYIVNGKFNFPDDIVDSFGRVTSGIQFFTIRLTYELEYTRLSYRISLTGAGGYYYNDPRDLNGLNVEELTPPKPINFYASPSTYEVNFGDVVTPNFVMVYDDDTIEENYTNITYDESSYFKPEIAELQDDGISIKVNTETIKRLSFIARPNIEGTELYATVAIVVLDAKNPYFPEGDSGEGGGNGSYGKGENYFDTVGRIPNGSAEANDSRNGLYTRYIMTSGELGILGEYLWADELGLQVAKTLISLLYGDPVQTVISCVSYPFNLSSLTSSSDVSFFWGGHDSGLSFSALNQNSFSIDWGTIFVSEFWGNFLDYSPHTQMQLYLPWGTGFVSIDPNDIMNAGFGLSGTGTLSVKTNVDLSRGMCVHNVIANNTVIGSYSGSCGRQIPITGSDYASKQVAMAGAAIGTMVAGAASAGLGAHAASTGRNIFGEPPSDIARRHMTESSIKADIFESEATAVGRMAIKPAIASAAALAVSPPSVSRSGSFQEGAGSLSIQEPYLIISRPKISIPEGYGHYYGYPSNITSVLRDLTGYTEVGSIHIEGIPATSKEIEEIEMLLKGGVIL